MRARALLASARRAHGTLAPLSYVYNSGEANKVIAEFLRRIDDEFHAVGDRCSHEDFSLADGEVWGAECEIECSKHGSTFDLRTGAPCSLPATRPVPVYELIVASGEVSVVVP